MHDLLRSIRFVVAFVLLVLHTRSLCTLTTLAKNDPFPVFTSLDPQDFLYKHTRPCPDREDPFCIHATRERYSISVSPFGQSACSGANFHGKRFLPSNTCNEISPCGSTLPNAITGTRIELGDLTGRINMIALLYGEPPANQELPYALKNASRCLFHTRYTEAQLPIDIIPSCIPQNVDWSTVPEIPNDNPLIPEDPSPRNELLCAPRNDPNLIDATQRYASLTFPLKYQKKGVRFDISADILHGFGINIQTGIANIYQQVERIRLDTRGNNNDITQPNLVIENDLTCQSQDLCDFIRPGNREGDPTINNNCERFTDNVKQVLTGNFDQIARELCVNIEDFNETSVEEVRLNLFWRHTLPINRDLLNAPKVTCMPYAMLSGSVSPGKKKNPNKLFGLPFGNDGYNSLGFSTGLNLDFINSIELSGEIGVTHFFGRTVHNLRIPNSIYQKTLFPFVADAHVKPGNNWHFAGKIASYHFLGNLSTYFQYVMIDHSYDSICLKCPEPAFVPNILAKTTAWKSKLANVGFTYDISPCVALGFLWQAPLSQKNTYRSSTILFTFNASF